MKTFVKILGGAAAVCLASIAQAGLEPVVKIDGRVLDMSDAAKIGLVLRESVSGDARTVQLENKSGAVIRPEELGWRVDGALLPCERRLKVYIESWQMASPCGVRNWNDEPFDYSPGYIANCISTPSDFRSGERGCFLSDHMCCFRDEKGTMTLFGFTTGKDRFGHFSIKLKEDQVAEFNAFCACDKAELAPGEKIVSETLAVLGGTDTEELFARYADRWAVDSNARNKAKPPVGWCSWYYYFSKVTLKDILENADWFAAHRKDGFDKVSVIQLDDGYQSALGDWLIANEGFPGGLPAFAREIKARGFTPALWVGPFMVEENSVLLKEHPDWVVKGADGKIASPLGWRGGHKVYSLDGTNPAVQDHLRALFGEIRKMGIDYVKLDFCMIASSIKDAKYFNPKATRAQALRWAFDAIREGFGEDGFILGCTAPYGPLVGVVDAMRSSTDIAPLWARTDRHVHAEAPTVPNVCRNVINHKYLDGRLWVNDPDTLIVRDDSTKLTQCEVELWTEAISLVGGSLLLSDRMSTLNPSRMPLVMKALAVANTVSVHPVDRWERTYPALWGYAKDGREMRTLFNFEDAPATIDGVEVAPHSCVRRAK